MFNIDFYRGKNILITGHTGFKGSWLCEILLGLGANVTGYALAPLDRISLFELTQMGDRINSIIGDIRDLEALRKAFDDSKPEIVIHLAAQPIVRIGYEQPVYTYETNIMGTVNVLECVRHSDSVKSFLNVTTDKVYLNKEWELGYRENEELNGFDPYSNSKSCSELVTMCYINSFFKEKKVAISTARAGNVIGGGDFSKDRIIPDCIRAALKKKDIVIRNPYSIRPYQHVLEPLMAYLMIAEKQYEEKKWAGSYNVGPDEGDCYSTGELVKLFIDKWKEPLKCHIQYDGGPHEALLLKLDCSKLKKTFGWKPRWNLEDAVEKVVEWTEYWMEGRNLADCMDKQIAEFFREK